MSNLNFSKNKISAAMLKNFSRGAEKKGGAEEGFSLVEVIIALVIFLIVLLGVFATFVYAINYNAGNNARSQGLTVMQQQAELIRSAKFTPTNTDDILKGGEKAEVPAQSEDGNRFKVKIIVDDDPFTSGVQINGDSTIKEISITVKLESPTPGWQTAVPTTVIMRRVRAN
jgi:prepilin-type N-terminal cleavage/methylation domain-containing protein